jgi:hypothetical protein
MRTRIALGAALAVSTILSITLPSATATAGASPRTSQRPGFGPKVALAPTEQSFIGTVRADGVSRFLSGAHPLRPLRRPIRRDAGVDAHVRTRLADRMPTSLRLRSLEILAVFPELPRPAPPPPPARPPAVAVVYTPMTDATSTGTADWACIRLHESGDRYNTPTAPSGAYGILQSTWLALGYSGWPFQASATVQDQAALRLFGMYGWTPWSTKTVCGL